MSTPHSAFPVYQLAQQQKGPKSFEMKSMEEVHRRNHNKTDEPHSHDYYTIIWVRNGEGNHMIDTRDYPVLPGMMFFIAPYQVHQLDVKDPQGCVFSFSLDFMCSNGVSDQFIDGLNLFGDENASVFVPDWSVPRMEKIVDWLQEESRQLNGQLRDESISALLKLFLLTCQRIKEARGNQSPVVKAKLHILSRKFQELVDEHYWEWHQVQEYAEELAVTPNHLKDVVKADLGKTAKTVIQDRIILEAKRKAHFSDHSMKAIALDLGFHDPSHFSKFFRSIEGMSFSEFKKVIR